MKEIFLKINGINSCVKTFWEKNKNPVLILHWRWGSSDSWINFSKIFEKKWNRIFIPDLPGHWKTWLNKIYTIDDYWDFVLDLIKKLNLKDFTLLGHSNWWRISLNLLIKNRIKPKRIFLIWCAWIRPKLNFKQKILQFLAKKLKFLKKIPWILFLRNIFYRLVWGQDYIKTDKNKFLKQTFLNVLEIDLTEKLHLITQKIELIWWSKDSYTPLYFWKKMSKLIKKSNLTILEWEKHWIHLQNPEILAKTITKIYDTSFPNNSNS